MSNDDTQCGLYNKYTVIKNSDPDSNFRGYVLNFDTDPYCVEALRAYAKACADEYPLLAADLEQLAAELQSNRTERAIQETLNDSTPAG
ncbi:hypothetical protein D3C75_878320 [compost metagenome]